MAPRYTIVTAYNAVDLDVRVNRLAKEGWLLLGPVTVTIGPNDDALYVATMFRE